jgi:prepilin-type N-terminal cleavage/methylation domain-containing protein
MKIGRKNKDKDDRGFSLVELVIVIAIMAVVAGTAMLSVSILTNKRVTKCADEITTTLERARVLTLGKAQNDVETVIYKDSVTGKYMAKIYQGGSVVSERELGKSPIEISVYFDNAVTGVSLESISRSGIAASDPADGLHVIFDRSSGAFKSGTSTGGSYFTKIEVTNGKKTVEINAVGKTGKISKQ